MECHRALGNELWVYVAVMAKKPFGRVKGQVSSVKEVLDDSQSRSSKYRIRVLRTSPVDGRQFRVMVVNIMYRLAFQNHLSIGTETRDYSIFRLGHLSLGTDERYISLSHASKRTTR